MRFVGTNKDDHICIVSDALFQQDGMKVVEVPSSLIEVSNSDLIANYWVKNGRVKHRKEKKPASKIKLALVGNPGEACGIGTYCRNLFPELIKRVGDARLFIEKNDHPIDNTTLPNQVSSCWKRGQSLQPLIKELKAYDPDIILIQHEFGLFPNARYWLSMMSRLNDYRVICTMHSVFHHSDKTIVEASMPEIVVHLEDAKQVLKVEKGISGAVYVIPHGCYAFNKERLWNFYKSSRTFVQAGFGFSYKNFSASIKACGILKSKGYADVFFTALFSESPYASMEHQSYYDELQGLVEQLGLRENVAIIRGFQSDAVLDSFFRTNQVAVFPYIQQAGHEVFGASGAARLAMATNIPVITSSHNHFADLPTIKADSPEEIAIALEKLFNDPETKAKRLATQEKHIAEHTWAKTAERYIKAFESWYIG